MSMDDDMPLQLVATTSHVATAFEMARVPLATVGTGEQSRSRGIMFSPKLSSLTHVRTWLSNVLLPAEDGWRIDSVDVSTFGYSPTVLATVSREVGGTSSATEEEIKEVTKGKSSNVQKQDIKDQANQSAKAAGAPAVVDNGSGERKLGDEKPVDVAQTSAGESGENASCGLVVDAKAKADCGTGAAASKNAVGEKKEVDKKSSGAGGENKNAPEASDEEEAPIRYVRLVDISGNEYGVTIQGLDAKDQPTLKINRSWTLREAREQIQRCFPDRTLQFVPQLTEDAVSDNEGKSDAVLSDVEMNSDDFSPLADDMDIDDGGLSPVRNKREKSTGKQEPDIKAGSEDDGSKQPEEEQKPAGEKDPDDRLVDELVHKSGDELVLLWFPAQKDEEEEAETEDADDSSDNVGFPFSDEEDFPAR
ncbi:unnamed protein product [Amoebophrya sp. A120]|nr:unnamed protein product [Amoebophrya sp. A120]|eukprot:GSA120T00018629001.1